MSKRGLAFMLFGLAGVCFVTFIGALFVASGIPTWQPVAGAIAVLSACWGCVVLADGLTRRVLLWSLLVSTPLVVVIAAWNTATLSHMNG